MAPLLQCIKGETLNRILWLSLHVYILRCKKASRYTFRSDQELEVDISECQPKALQKQRLLGLRKLASFLLSPEAVDFGEWICLWEIDGSMNRRNLGKKRF